MTDPWGPIDLDPILVPKVWGGHRLAELPAFGGAIPVDGGPIGEAWVVADLPEDVADGRSRIRRGPWAGRTLRDLIQAHPEAVLGRAAVAEGGGFPLLVKWLDAATDLSVQVHPTPAYAAEHPASAGPPVLVGGGAFDESARAALLRTRRQRIDAPIARQIYRRSGRKAPSPLQTH